MGNNYYQALIALALLSACWSVFSHGHYSSAFLNRHKQQQRLEQHERIFSSGCCRRHIKRFAFSLCAEATTDKRRTSPKEVTQMFNDYADHFEEKLVKTLEYSAPLDVARAVSRRIFNNNNNGTTTTDTSDDDETTAGGGHRRGLLYTSALDAGCGTGLMGVHLRNLVDGPLIGVDLSPKMAELAAELVTDDRIVADPSNQNGTMPQQLRRSTESARLALGNSRVYDGVFLADLLELLSSSNARPKPLPDAASLYGHEITEFPTTDAKPGGGYYDLIAAADVLCYFGEMETILETFSRLLAPGGDLLFSTETLAVGDYNWVMLVSERYAHDAEYVARMANKAGLVVVSQRPFTPRMELGEEVLGTLHVFHKPIL